LKIFNHRELVPLYPWLGNSNTNPLNGFFNVFVDICRYSAKIYGFYGRNKAFTGLTVFLGLSASAPKQFQSMGNAAFRANTLDCKTLAIVVPTMVNTALFFL
jgi:hypothetical protein